MKFKSILGALAVSLMPLQSMAQESAKVTSVYSDQQKYICASYWNPNPRARLCYEGDDNVTLGFFLPPSKNTWKLVFGNTKDNEEAGIYFNQKKAPLRLGQARNTLMGKSLERRMQG